MTENERIKELEYENNLLKVTYARCRDCKHADLYIPAYTYPFFNPRCKLTTDAIKAEQKACKEFKMIGRGSR